MNDYGKMNQLPPEVKILIVEGQSLVDRTREAMKGRMYDMGLTGKFRLQDDCKAVERHIKALSKGKADEKKVQALEKSILCLKTTAGALLGVK